MATFTQLLQALPPKEVVSVRLREEVLNASQLPAEVSTRNVTLITSDTRQVAVGSEGVVFVAVKGTQRDGHDFIQGIIEARPLAIVFEESRTTDFAEVLAQARDAGIILISVTDTPLALGRMSQAFHSNPSLAMRIIGVTGTNGKTTVTTLLHQLFMKLGIHAGLIGTVAHQSGDEVLPSSHTTPGAEALAVLLAQMQADGCEVVFMEVSSHALAQKRTAGVRFSGAVFTNLTHDHLDYHGSFAAYRDAKKLLFDELDPEAFALVNADDRNGEVMLQNTAARRRTFALNQPASFSGRVLENTFDGLLMTLASEALGGTARSFHSPLLGEFNASNLLCAYAVALEMGPIGADAIQEEDVLIAISRVTAPIGRAQRVLPPSGISDLHAMVDYAHTPDALENILQTLRGARQNDAGIGGGVGSQAIHCVVGCGGDRDAEKRPKMAAIAASLADRVILTSDNPRSEDPEAILDMMWQGVPIERRNRTMRITSRREAIRAAVQQAQAGDIILVAGKGHENYQEIKGERLHFSDAEELANALEERQAGMPSSHRNSQLAK